MNPAFQTLIIKELARLEFLGYVGLLGTKYLSNDLTNPDPETGCRITFVTINPKTGWAIVAFGPPDGEQKYKFLRDVETGRVYDGLETAETMH